MNLQETLRTHCETFIETIEVIISSEYGEDFVWDNHVNRLWGEGGDQPKTASASEEYMLIHLWNIREELNGCLHWIDSHSEEELAAFIKESHPRVNPSEAES